MKRFIMINVSQFSAIIIILFSNLFYTCLVSASASQSEFEWKKALPESQGMSSEKLDNMWHTLKKKRTHALIIIRNDHIVFERYAEGYSKEKKHHIASLAKSSVGGLSLLVALNDGLIEIDDLACKYIPQWRHDPQRSKITIKHLATNSSGISHGKPTDKSYVSVDGWQQKFWKRNPDPFSIARDYAPVMFESGTSFAYSGPGYAMLGYAITASLQDEPQDDIYNLLKERILSPIGVKETDWTIGYGRSYIVDGLKLYAIYSGSSFTPRAIARIGRFMLRKGNWEGRQLVDPIWVEKITTYADTPIPERISGEPKPASGLCWWVNYDRIWPSVPSDAFVGAGAGNQVLLVVPSLNLIVVRNGGSLNQEILTQIKEYFFKIIGWPRPKNDYFMNGNYEYIFNPVMESIVKID
jgi:CubicO group peptidase (beta-lactamase class C family)